MWRKRTHTLSPLPKLFSTKVKFKWTDVYQNSFRKMKKIVGKDILILYPNLSEDFIIHTDARKMHSGEVIRQNSKPIAFYSHKLNSPQINYKTIKRELLSIVEIPKEFHTILLRQHITV